MNEITQINYPEKNKSNNQTNLSLNSHLLNPTPLGNNPSISIEILYFSINQDSK